MIRLSHPTATLSGTIDLPRSKSVSNRMLILQKLYEPSLKLDNVSIANDSVLLKQILTSDIQDIDVQDAGTAFRFLTAYCAATPGEWSISGTARLSERPIAELVDVLRLFGADIVYTEKEGYAPLKIVGKKLVAKQHLIDLHAVKSSQFISAILLIAPLIEGEFNLKVNKKMSSYSYVQLTISCLRRMGFSVFIKGSYLRVSKQQKFDGEYFYIEPDWSSFYYWVSMVHLAKEVDLFFPGIRLNNMQKERKYLFEVGNSGVLFEEINDGMRITKSRQGEIECGETFNFSQYSDSAMTFGMLLPALGCVEHTFLGLESLKYKECNRENALTDHLALIGVSMTKEGIKWLIDAEDFELKEDTLFPSYEDHRMAMSVAPLALLQPIRIEDETVVKKSYPHFWDDLKSVGFIVLQL